MIVELTLSFVLWLGMAGLILDGSRWMLLRNELQYVASGAAAAGAKALDQSPGSIERARQAATAIGNANIGVLDSLSSASINAVRFCSALPCVETGADDAAKYIVVDVAGQTAAIFPLTPFRSLPGNATAFGG